MSEHLTLVEVMRMHADLTARYGGTAGLRDPGLLGAALYRPQTGYYADLVQEAAALWDSLSQGRPFVDGNRRLAFAATDVFLRLNGRMITADPAQTWADLSHLYETGECGFQSLDRWLRANTAKV
jgi:death-on-curing protein